MKKYLIILIAALAACLFVALKWVNNLEIENTRLSGNQLTLLSKSEMWENRYNQSLASVQKLELTAEELRQSRESYVNLCNELGVKIKRLQSASRAELATNINVTAPVRDTIIQRDTIEVAKAFSWSDSWTNISGIIRDSVEINYRSIDTLEQIVYRVPKKFLFFRFGTKAIKQTIKSNNPNNRIIFTEYIELRK